MIKPRWTLIGLLISGLLASCSTATDGSGAPGTSASSTTPTRPTSVVTTTPASRPATSAAPSSSAPSSSASVPSTPLRTETITAMDGSTTWEVKVWVEDNTVNCEGHAYGAKVVAFLKANLCRGMTRLLASTTVNGKQVGIAQSLISFSDGAPQSYQTAGTFKDLVTQNGTGNISDLLREGKRFPNSGSKVGDPDAFSAETQDAGVGITDVWHLGTTTPENDPALLTLARSLFLQLH